MIDEKVGCCQKARFGEVCRQLEAEAAARVAAAKTLEELDLVRRQFRAACRELETWLWPRSRNREV